MKPAIKSIHFILSFLIIALCSLIILSYGWIGFATITDRPGINGHWYLYLGLTRNQFFIYNLTVFLGALGLILAQTIALITKRPKLLIRASWLFLLFFCILVGFEICLQLKFVPKG